MDSAGFSAARWDHWLLVVAFIGMAGYGLHLSWQWRRAAQRRKERSRIAHQLAIDVHSNLKSHLQAKLQSEHTRVAHTQQRPRVTSPLSVTSPSRTGQ